MPMWFRRDGGGSSFTPTSSTERTTSIGEVVRSIMPKKLLDPEDAARNRFSQLLLEHGEKHLQDWAVVASSQSYCPSTSSSGKTTTTTTNGSSPTTIMRSSSHGGGGRSSTTAMNTTTTNTTLWAQQSSSSSSRKRPHHHYNNNNVTNPHRRYHQQHSHRSAQTQYSVKRPSVQIYEKAFAPSVNMGTIEGRLHLCSQSLVFEPLDITRGIVRCPFGRMDTPPRQRIVDVNDDMNDNNRNTKHKQPTNTVLHDIPTTTTTTTALSSPTQQQQLVIEFHCSRHLVMKANNVVGPYDSIEVPVQFRFTFLHSHPQRFVELCQDLHAVVVGHGGNRNHARSSHNHNKSSSTTTPEQLLDAIMKPMLNRPFDPSNLVDVRERPLTSNLRCSLVTPLQSRPGCAIVTNERIYFQPAVGVLQDDDDDLYNRRSNNSAATTAAQTWLLCDLVARARRYSGLRDSALELYWKDGSSVLLAFERPREREKVMRLLLGGSSSSSGNMKKHVPCHTDRDFVVEVLREWQNGNISNYDYLLALNSAAGRTFHDLSRYPVFPWVIADYDSEELDLTKESTFRDMSKPMGALNEERLEYFRTRLHGMHDMDDAFLYGTHYSAPGYVLYYLVRNMPEHMLCLQNGKFDAADRMFYSISHCYSCALTNHADVKELIPEFYNPASGFDFLINARSLQLGATQTGDRVDDVALPPWAKSPRDYLRKNRRALESDICTNMLPRWIDLMFGVKSRGEAAREASNLFHPMAYLGPKDLQKMDSDEERFQAELQAVEFGIVPDMLFAQPHPLREDPADLDECVLSDFGRAVLGDGDASIGPDGESRTGEQAWELLESPSAHSQEEEKPVGSADSCDIVPRRKKRTTSLGFSSAALIPSTNSIDMDQTKQALSPHTPTSQARDGVDPATPGGKAKSTWVPDLAVPSMDSLASEDREGQDALGTSGSIERKASAEEPYKYLGSVPEGDGRNRKLPLSGSGDYSRIERRISSRKEGGDRPARRATNAASIQRAIPSEAADPDTGWDLAMIEKKQLTGDSVSGCSLLLEVGPDEGALLTTVSLDGSLLVHTFLVEGPQKKDRYDAARRGFTGTLSKFPYIGGGQTTTTQSKLSPYRKHTSADPLACLARTGDGHGGQVVFAGGHDDVVLAYGINSACAVASVYSHRDAVTGLDIIERPSIVKENMLWSETSTHIMVSGSWDATVKVWSVRVGSGEAVSIDREPLAELFDADSSVGCLSATPINGGVAICAGCDDGSFVVWLLHDDGTKVMIHKEQARRGSGPCSAVQWIREKGQLYLLTSFATGKIASFALSNGAVRKLSAVSVGVPVKCMAYAEGILLVGCSDGGLRLLPLGEGAYFDARPTLFPALHGKQSSAGITCVSMAFTSHQCMCSTGAEDGSVAIFELKRDTL